MVDALTLVRNIRLADSAAEAALYLVETHRAQNHKVIGPEVARKVRRDLARRLESLAEPDVLIAQIDRASRELFDSHLISDIETEVLDNFVNYLRTRETLKAAA